MSRAWQYSGEEKIVVWRVINSILKWIFSLASRRRYLRYSVPNCGSLCEAGITRSTEAEFDAARAGAIFFESIALLGSA